jgi:hypothetical protein
VPRNVEKEDIIPVDEGSFKNVLESLRNSETKHEMDKIDIVNPDQDKDDEV